MVAQIPPEIPEAAPFRDDQRQWLNGYLAALFPASSVVAGKSGKPIRILYASQSGNSETLAEGFGERLSKAGFAPSVQSMEDVSSADLVGDERLLVISSTWGDGDPPDAAVDFWETLSSEEQPRLEKMQFSVLGLGDSNYLHFCGMAKKWDSRFEELGAQRMFARVDCDTDFEEPAEEWFQGVLGELGGSASPEGEESRAKAGPIAYGKKNPFPASLLTNRRLNGADSGRDTRHFEISLAGSGLSYEVGDVLGVLPENDPAAVDALLEALPFDGETATPLPDGTEVSLRLALLRTYDIRSVSRKLL
ncbi:MAG: flavodoxin domain-containing protein, partial [Verrucomicrobiota bacterium]